MQRNQNEDKAQVMQRCTQVDEDVGMRWSSQEGEAEEEGEAAKGRSLRRCRDEVTRTRPWTGSEVQTRPWSARDWIIRGKTRRSGLNETTTKCGGGRPDAPDWSIRAGTSSRGCRPPDWIIRGQVAARRHGLDHPGRTKQPECPHPVLDHQGTRGGQTPRTGSSGVHQAAGATAPRTRFSRDRCWAEARTGSSGADQEGAARTPGAREIWLAAPGRMARGGSIRMGPHPPGCSVQGKVAARGEGNRRPRPRSCSEGVKTDSNAEENAEEMQRGREEDGAEETQGSKDQEGAVVKQRNRPMDEAGLMQGSSHEDKAEVQQRS